MQRRVKSPGEGPNGTHVTAEISISPDRSGCCALTGISPRAHHTGLWQLVHRAASPCLWRHLSCSLCPLWPQRCPSRHRQDMWGGEGGSRGRGKGRKREGEGRTQEKTHGRKTNPCFFTSKETIGNTIIMANFFWVFAMSQVLSKHFACIDPLNLYISPLSFLPLSPHFIDRETKVQSPCMLFTVLRYLTFPVSMRAGHCHSLYFIERN